MKCIDDEIPFEIPSSWEWCRIFQIGSSQLGKTLDRGKEQGNEYPYLCSINVYWDGIDLSKVKTFKLQDSELERYKVCIGDLLICEGGDYGRCAVWDREDEMYYQNALHRVRFFYNISPYFYKYVIELYRNIGYIVGQGQTIKHFTYENMKSLLFPLPPLNEQRNVVNKIDSVLSLTSSYTISQDALDKLNTGVFIRLKQSILQEAIQGHLVPQDPADEPAEELLKRIHKEKEKLVKEGKLKRKDVVESDIFKGEDNKYYEQINDKCLEISEEIPFDIPDSWAWCRFGEYVKMKIGKTPARGFAEFWSNGVYPWVSISDMTDYGMVTSTKEKISEIAAQNQMGEMSPIGTLLMSFKLTVGRTSILNVLAYHNEAIISVFPFVDENNYTRDYLFYSLPLISNLGDSKDAIKGKTLNSQSLNKMLLPIPPLHEQKRIVDRIRELFGYL